LISTSHAGRTSRIANHRHEALAAGEELRVVAVRRDNAQTSESEAARAYSNGAAFKVRSPE